VSSPFDLPLTCYDPGAFIATGMDLLELVARPEVEEMWNEPSALEMWSVRTLVGHAVGPLELILTDCEQPEPATPRFRGIVEYTRMARLEKREDLDLEAHHLIKVMADERAAKGRDHVVETATRWVEELKWMLPAMDPNKHVYLPRMPPMAGPLAMMVMNRTMELTVHMDDLAVSVGLPTPPIRPEAGAMALTVLMSVARRANGDLEILRAMARQERAKPNATRAI
jgi:hypothetical protein